MGVSRSRPTASRPPVSAASSREAALPIRISTIELIEIGAGGGSIAHVDEIGLLKVGPRSAGSLPGPAAYGLGGTEATVTDADFVLGYLNPDYFAGGSMKIDLEAPAAALGRLAERVGLSLVDVAWGIHDIVNENMAGAARVHIAERGRDPREYALLCTGGAGPVHAHSVAEKIGLRRVICPPSAGVASALGLLVAPARVDRVATVGIRLDRDDCAELEAAFRRLEDEARTILAASGVALGTATFQRLADGRFLGQGFDLVVTLPPGPMTARTARAPAGRCAQPSRRPTARSSRSRRRTCPSSSSTSGWRRGLPWRGAPSHSTGARERRAAAAVKGQRPAYFRAVGGFVETTVYDRAHGSPSEKSWPARPSSRRRARRSWWGPVRGRVAPTGNVIVTLADP